MESFLRLKRNWTARSITIVVMLSMVFWAHPEAWGLTIMESGDDFGAFPGNIKTFPSALGANTYSGTLTDPTDKSDFIKIELNGLSIVSGFVSYLSGGTIPDIDFIFVSYTPAFVITTFNKTAGETNIIPQNVISIWNANGVAEIGIKDTSNGLTASYMVGITNVPEPSTLLLLGSGLAGLVAWRMRKGRA